MVGFLPGPAPEGPLHPTSRSPGNVRAKSPAEAFQKGYASRMDLSELTTEDQLAAVFERSAERRQLIFKHSSTCPISGTAHSQMRDYLARTPAENVDYSMIVVQNHRPLSNQVAQRLDVRHESPQVLLVRDGAATWTASHFDITTAALSDALEG